MNDDFEVEEIREPSAIVVRSASTGPVARAQDIAYVATVVDTLKTVHELESEAIAHAIGMLMPLIPADVFPQHAQSSWLHTLIIHVCGEDYHSNTRYGFDSAGRIWEAHRTSTFRRVTLTPENTGMVLEKLLYAYTEGTRSLARKQQRLEERSKQATRALEL